MNSPSSKKGRGRGQCASGKSRHNGKKKKTPKAKAVSQKLVGGETHAPQQQYSGGKFCDPRWVRKKRVGAGAGEGITTGGKDPSGILAAKGRAKEGKHLSA